MIRLKSCKRDGQRLAITLADGEREERVYLGPQSVGSAFIQQESNAQELAKVIVDAVNALQSKPGPIELMTQLAASDPAPPPPPDEYVYPAHVVSAAKAEVAKSTKRSGK